MPLQRQPNRCVLFGPPRPQGPPGPQGPLGQRNLEFEAAMISADVINMELREPGDV